MRVHAKPVCESNVTVIDSYQNYRLAKSMIETEPISFNIEYVIKTPADG